MHAHYSITDSEERKLSLPTLWEKAEKGVLQATTTSAMANESAENSESRIKKEEECSEKSPSRSSKARERWKKAITMSLDEPETADDIKERKDSASASMGMNPSGRQVWRPKQQPRLADLVASLSSQKKQGQTRGTSPPLSPISKISLQSRQQMLQSRVQDRVHTTKAFFEDDILDKERNIASKPSKSLSRFKDASKRVLADVKRNRNNGQGSPDVADVLSLYLAKMRAESNNTKSPQATQFNEISTAHRGSQMKLRKRLSAQSSAASKEEKPGTIPLERWCKIVRENKSQIRAKTHTLETEV